MAGAKPLDRSKLTRAAKVLPSSAEGGGTLDTIANKEVVIVGVSFEPRTGRKSDSHPDGKYTRTIITLDDETIVHTGSEIIREQMAKLQEGGHLPALATFGKVRSASNPTQSYWSILPDDSDEKE